MAELWIIEDREGDRVLLVRLLERGGLMNPTRCFPDAESALEALETDTLPTLIILDLELPRMDGMEFLSTIRQKPYTRSIPVVVLTISQAQSELIESYWLGANAYLHKPVELVHLLAAFAVLGLKWTIGG